MRYTGIHSFLDMLDSCGVSAVFGNPGTTELPLNDALLTDPRFRYYLGLHEVPVMSMADGYAQASGQVACVNVHTGCGLGNAMGMMYNAYQEGTPLLVTAGQQDRRLQLAEPVLGGDLVSVARPWTKWAYEVPRCEDLPLAVKRAVQTALTPPKGPVFLALPLDIQRQPCEPPDLRRFALTRPRLGLSNSEVKRATDVLSQSRRPAILAGSRVVEDGGSEALAELAEFWGAPVYFESPTSHGRLPIASDHPMVAGPLPLWSPDIADTLANYDCVLVCGMNLFRLYVYFEPEFPLTSETRIVQLDSAVTELGKNAAPEVAVWAPIGQGLEAIRATLQDAFSDEQVREVEARRQGVADRLARQRIEFQRQYRGRAGESSQLTSAGLMMSVVDWVPPRIAVVEEAVTTANNALARFQVLKQPEGYFGHRGWALGWGAGFACGVQAAWPDRPVLALLGDGSTIYGLQALWTAVRYELPVTFLICNNRQYQILKEGARLLELENAGQGAFLGMDLVGPELNFVQLAEGFGMSACRVDDAKALAAALREPAETCGPRLIDAVIRDPVASD